MARFVEPTFFEHVKRPAWGLCILAGETPAGRRYQFEDGKLRTIAFDFADKLMHEVEPPEEARNGPLRRYRVTPEGVSALRESMAAVRRLARGLERLLGEAR